MARQHEHRVVVRWVVAPPTLPFLVGPRPADRAEHVAAHDRGADAGVARDHEPLVDALVAALLANHATSVTCREDPLVQPRPAHAKRVVKALQWPRAVPVDGDREVMNAKFRHGKSPQPYSKSRPQRVVVGAPVISADACTR